MLVLRGTEIATDLTCEPQDFEPATSPDDDLLPVNHPSVRFFVPPGPTPNKSSQSYRRPRVFLTTFPRYYVYGGMARMAQAACDPGKPVQLAVREARISTAFFFSVSLGEQGPVVGCRCFALRHRKRSSRASSLSVTFLLLFAYLSYLFSDPSWASR